jgi:hypothetical protein
VKGEEKGEVPNDEKKEKREGERGCLIEIRWNLAWWGLSNEVE